MTGELDAVAFRSNLRGWLEHPIRGLVVGGSTGEAPLLDEGELLRLVEWTRELAPEEVLVTAGTGAESTRATIRQCREAAARGAGAALVRAPCYYRSAMDDVAIRTHFIRVADASPIPVVLYHIPKFVPIDLTAETVAALARHEQIVGIKDSAGELERLGRYARACEGHAELVVGAGTLLYAALEVGAVGGVLGVGLLATGLCCELVEAWREGETERAGALQERIGPLHRTVVSGLGVPGVKVGLDLLGRVGGEPRPPLRRPGEEGARAVEGALRAARLLS